MFKHILIPTDGSDLATLAVDKGVALADSLGAAVTIVTVSEPFHILSADATQIESSRAGYEAAATAAATRVLNLSRAKAKAAGLRVETHHKWHDNPWQAIIDTALAEGCDLIVMSSHGRRGVAAVVLGSQTTRILTHSRIPVLVIR